MRSMAEAHLEMDDGSTLPLIRICHTADGDRALHAGSYRLQRGSRPVWPESPLLKGLPESRRNEKARGWATKASENGKETWKACARVKAMLREIADIKCKSKFQEILHLYENTGVGKKQ